MLFLIGILGQAVSGMMMQHLGAGWTPTSVASYYRGDDTPAAIGGDRFGMDDDADPSITATASPPRTMHVARSFGTLVEVAHLHLVAMPLVLFVIAHLFSMIPAGRGALGGALCYLGFAGAALDILSPFAIRYLSAGFAPFKLAGFFLLEASLVTMVVMTLFVCISSFFAQPSGTSQAPRPE